MAKIKYGEKTMAEITTGQSIRLHTAGQEMEHDIEIEGFASGEGGSGESSGEMTGVGADVWVVMEGKLYDFYEFFFVMQGEDINSPDVQYEIQLFKADTYRIVGDELPDLSLIDDKERFGDMLMGVTKNDGEVYLYDTGSGAWMPLSTALGFTAHGWIEKSELDALDYTEANNAGVYLTKSVSYPLIDGTLVDLSSNVEPMIGGFENSLFLKTINLPNIKCVKRYAFNKCMALTSVNIPKAVCIGEYSFAHCKLLEEINFGKEIFSLGNDAFRGCTSLSSVVIPASVTDLGNYLFSGCTSLTNITFEGTIDQFKELNRSQGWNYNVPATEVICSDGVFSLV